MAARYVCGLSFFILFTYIHLFSPFCCLVQVRKKRHEVFKTLAPVMKYMTEKKGMEEMERAIWALTQAAINICRCKVPGIIVQGNR